MNKNSRKKKVATPPTTLTPSDKVKVLIILPLAFVGLAVLFHFICVSQQTGQITKTVNGWKSTYNLDDEQARRTIQIELDFHGNGSPFSLRGHSQAEEKHRHYEKISQLMSPTDGARFMHAMEKKGENH